MTAPALPPIPTSPEDGHVTITKNNLNAIARRVAPLDALVLLLIACRTTSARKLLRGGPRRHFARIEMAELRSYCGKPGRTIGLRLPFLESNGYIPREIPHVAAPAQAAAARQPNIGRIVRQLRNLLASPW